MKNFKFAEKNLNWLKSYYPKLSFKAFDDYLNTSKNLDLTDNASAALGDGSIVANYCSWCQDSTRHQLDNPTQFLTPRLLGGSQDIPFCSLDSIIDSEQRPLLDYLLSNQSQTESLAENQPTKASTLVVFGSHAFLGLVSNDLHLANVTEIIFVEGQLADFACASSELDIAESIIQIRDKKIGFTAVFSESPEEAKSAIESYICHSSPTILYGLKVIKSPSPSPYFANIEAWLNSSFGLAAYVPYYLGNETDEINQSLHAIISHYKYPASRKIISGYATEALDGAVVITASGPSLDSQIDRLKDISLQGGTIVASGSSFGTLLRNGITPSYVVFLEMSSQVYRDLLELVIGGFSFEGITAVLSLSVDPRIPALFEKFISFQRPQINTLSLFPQESSSSLIQSGPQVVNAALEFALCIGARKFILLGCDFSSSSRRLLRSSDAIGVSQRELNVPHRGLSGKTVYSCPDLLITANAFTQALTAFNSIAFTNANIVDNGSQRIKLVDSFVDISLCSSTAFAARVDQLCFEYTSDNYNQACAFLIKQIKAFPVNIKEINSRILSVLRESKEWTYDISRFVSTFIAFPGMHSDFSYEIKVFRSLYFFLLHPFYLSISYKSWDQQITLLEQQFQQLEKFSSALAQFYAKIPLIADRISLEPDANRNIFKSLLIETHE